MEGMFPPSVLLEHHYDGLFPSDAIYTVCVTVKVYFLYTAFSVQLVLSFCWFVTGWTTWEEGHKPKQKSE
jgi:hypothetical protein